jgi:hypothetical protein
MEEVVEKKKLNLRVSCKQDSNLFFRTKYELAPGEKNNHQLTTKRVVVGWKQRLGVVL